MNLEKIQRVVSAAKELVDAVQDVYQDLSMDMCHARLEWRRYYTEVDVMMAGNEFGDFARKIDAALLIMCSEEMKVND